MNQLQFAELVVRQDVEAIAAGLAADASLADQDFPETLLPKALGLPPQRPIHVAAVLGHVDVIAALAAVPCDMDAKNGDGRTALHVALELNNNSTQALIDHGAYVDICAAAALNDTLRISSLLDENEALANDRSTDITPLAWAAYFCAVPAAELLLKRGALMDDSELECAAAVGATPIARLLLANGYDMNQQSACQGVSALHVAATHRYSSDTEDFVRFLLDQGANPALALKGGETTPLMLARSALARQRTAGIEKGDDAWKNFDGVVALLDKVSK